MRRVRGGPVGGESETRHRRGQTIMRSIEDDIQTKEYREYRDYLYWRYWRRGPGRSGLGVVVSGKDRVCNGTRGYGKGLDRYRVDGGKD